MKVVEGRWQVEVEAGGGRWRWQVRLEVEVGWEVEGGAGRSAEAGFASDLSVTCIMVSP